MAGKCCGSLCREPLGGRSNDGPQGSSRDPLPARVFNGWRTYSILAAAARRPVGKTKKLEQDIANRERQIARLTVRLDKVGDASGFDAIFDKVAEMDRALNGVRDRNRSLENDPAPIGEEVTVPGAHFAVEGLRMTTNPRLMPESESTIFMAFHKRAAGTHTGGYAYRETSRIRKRSVHAS